MPRPKVYVAHQLRDLLNEDDDVLTGGMTLLDAGQRSRLIGCLGMAQWKGGDDMQAPEPATGECQTPEVRYVQSSDQAVSGDSISQLLRLTGVNVTGRLRER